MCSEEIHHNSLLTVCKSIDEINYGSKRQELISILNNLIDKDFDSIVQLLYQVDVEEKKLKAALIEKADCDAAPLIADLIIERQLEKIETRKKFPEEPTQAGDDRW